MSIVLSRTLRLGIGLVFGVVVGALAGGAWGLGAGIVSGWAVGAVVVAGWILLEVWRMDGDATRLHATREDPGLPVARVISVGGSVVSLVAVGLVLVDARGAADERSFILAGIAVLSVIASWLLIQVDYMLRVAREYYADPIGGVDFNQDDDPQYTDFAYFSLGLGMTYQVADTSVRTNAIRRIVIAQTLLAYLFGAVILATVINLVTSLG